MSFVGDAFRYVTSTVDGYVVTPVANRLATSVANPFVLSYVIWDRVKKLTPQRARDVSRLLSTAVANAVGVLGADQAKRLATSSRQLQDHVVAAAVSPHGRDVLLNSVATAAKVAQAFNTPEMKIATHQVFETVQSLVDFFASDHGRKVLASAGECINHVCEVAASPESAVFLAEVATNVCHALDVEAMRRATEHAATTDDQEATAASKTMTPQSPMTSAEDTGFETESNMSEVSLPPAAVQLPRGPTPAPPPVMREPNALRSARIERDVLLKMGVDPGMLEEVQRILDRLQEDQRRQEAAANDIVLADGEDIVYATTDDEGGGEEEISSAFGIRSSSLPLNPEPVIDELEETKTEDETASDIVLPEWHPEPVRNALRRRHVADQARTAQRHTFEDQSRDMAQVLARRRVVHGDLEPMDVIACRAISTMIVAGVAFVVLWLIIFLLRRIPI